MPGEEEEIPLRGGRVSRDIVRVGDTVRRTPRSNAEFVRRLLLHLTARGFAGAPAFLGTDAQGRDVLTYIEGEVPADLGFHDDATLRAAALLIRLLHDLGAELVSPDAAAGIEVACHNDLSPCNFVFRAGVPVAIIDFDAAAPGSRAHDLGYAAWPWLDLGSPEIAVADQRRRLSLFLAAYGIDDYATVLAAIQARQAILVEQARRLGDDAMAQWAADCLAWTQRRENELLDGA